MPDLPWYAYLFASIFWGLMTLRVWRRFTGRSAVSSDAGAQLTEDSPAWSPFRSRGF